MLEECAHKEKLEYNVKTRSRSDTSQNLQRIKLASVLEEVIRGVQSFWWLSERPVAGCLAARSARESALVPRVAYSVSNSCGCVLQKECAFMYPTF